MTTFIELVRQGKYTPHQIDDWVGAWHESETDQELHESIGMTLEQYKRWAADPDTLIPIIGEHGVVTEDEDLKIDGLHIQHNIDGDTQESSFGNACLSSAGDIDISIAATPPVEYHKTTSKDFNEAMLRELAPLIAAGWTFEIQRGMTEETHENLQDEMVAEIEG